MIKLRLRGKNKTNTLNRLKVGVRNEVLFKKILTTELFKFEFSNIVNGRTELQNLYEKSFCPEKSWTSVIYPRTFATQTVSIRFRFGKS